MKNLLYIHIPKCKNLIILNIILIYKFLYFFFLDLYMIFQIAFISHHYILACIWSLIFAQSYPILFYGMKTIFICQIKN